MSVRIHSLGLAALMCLGSHPRTIRFAAATRATQQNATNDRYADDAVVVRGEGSEITWKELEPLLIARRAFSPEGREALTHLAKSKLLETLAREQSVEVTEKTLDARCAEIEAQIKAAGKPGGLEEEIRRVHLSREEFRATLRLAIVQETLTRRALGKRDDEPVSGEQQELWLDEMMKERKLELLAPPWKDGVAARGAGFSVSDRAFLLDLRRNLPADTLRDDAYQLLRLKRVLARMPDVAREKVERYVDEELDRKRATIAADPRYKGIPWEQLLQSQGIQPQSMRDDPDVRAIALSRLWVERNYDDATLKRVYADEREHFDSAYGAAIDVRMVFLRASDLSREDGLRPFKEAQEKLEQLAARATSIDEFHKLAKETSEDAQTREAGGAMGYVTPGNPRVPEAVRAIVRRELEAKPTLAASSTGYRVGPVRLPNGVALLWLGARRGAPTWEQMSQAVLRELRQRFLDEALPRAKMVEVFRES